MDDDIDGHGLPDPALTLTLPSIHDGTPLDCRIYLPPSILAVASSTATNAAPSARRWRGNAAVVAHPYAPMGGSYNDPVVKMVAQTLLSSPSEFVVATFNFRGAGRKPQGRTSWTAKPETGDYMTIAGFLYYFSHFLDPYGEKETPSSPGLATQATQHPTLLFAGYSYGAMVTSLLPPLATILGFFARPLRGSPGAEVRLRAARWAAIQNADFSACRARLATHDGGGAPCSPTRGSPSKTRLSMGVRVGSAADDDGHWRRKSHEASSLSISTAAAAAATTTTTSGSGSSLRHILSPSSPRRSLSTDRRHAGNGHAHSHLRSSSSNDATSATATTATSEERSTGGVAGWMARVRHSSSRGDEAAEEAVDGDSSPAASSLPVVAHLSVMRPAYLLVSPVIGLVTNLLTMSFGASAGGAGLFKRKKAATAPVAPASNLAVLQEESSPAADAAGHSQEAEGDKLARHPTLVVFGEADSFASAKKMRQWTASLTAASAVVSAPVASAAAEPKTLFRAREVPTAGHFWHEGRTFYELHEEVAAFAADIGKD
ncbi:hypothetical protein SCUCBS95973_007203 [Sporothrix curviconia]|uniref:Acid phosphatase n=1 Tax=Sporothrix curviconia TaxID=1260050 RepID=A0ABP0CC31_9PEZI